MTTSSNPKEAYVWVWLPSKKKPVVAGKLERVEEKIFFNYGQSYLENKEAIALYAPELPLQRGVIKLANGLSMPNTIRDASPDAWGRRVIINKIFSKKNKEIDTDTLDELTYLLESGSDRIGALDFQQSPTEYIPRSPSNARLEELIESARLIEKGVPLSPELQSALLHGTAIGGARPKALIESDDKKFIAKFSSSTDLYNIVKAEFIAMKLAKKTGLNVAEVHLKKAAQKDVLLIERFDREKKENFWTRKMMVSALTILSLDEMMARYASYEDLAQEIRANFVEPKKTLRELFTRLVFNILCGNTDDHARNHAAFHDGKNLSLTPAYDICPQGRAGNEATQAMLIHGKNNFSQLKTCLLSASNFLLSKDDALTIFDHVESCIRKYWDEVCEEAELSQVEKNLLWQRQFLNPFSLERN